MWFVFINVRHSVNTHILAPQTHTYSTGCSGSFMWATIHERSKGRKIILTASKSWYSCCSQPVFGTCNSQKRKRIPDGSISITFLYAHARACSFIYTLHRRELWVSLSWSFLDSIFLSFSRSWALFAASHQSSISSLCYFLFRSKLPFTLSILRSS